MAPTNRAAWLTAAKSKPLDIKDAPYPSPTGNQIVVRACALAINPVDWLLQEQGTSLMFTWLKYPCILGTDVAGKIVEVGSSITRFKAGDRVIGQAVGQDQKLNDPAQGAFQNYVVLFEHMTSPIPDTISYESACVVPLGASTAACGLFEKDQLALQLPSISPKPAGKTVLIWGGSTSVGCNAIQLAVAAGYEVFTTCSPKNFDCVKRLGAARVFDYNSPTVVQDLIKAFEGKPAAGALSIGSGAADACMDVLHANNSKGSRKFVAMATYPTPESPPKRFVMLTTIYTFMSWSVKAFIKSKLHGSSYKFIFATSLAFNGIGKALYQDYLPEALKQGKCICAPEPLVVQGKGLERIQEGMDLQRRGVSARKVVVMLE